MWLCSLYYGALRILKYCLALCPRVSSFLFSIVGKRELVYVLLMHLFVCFVHVCFCPFSLPLGAVGWLRLVIVAFPGLFINFFETTIITGHLETG